MLASLDNFSAAGLQKFLEEINEARNRPAYYAEFVKTVQSLTEAQLKEFIEQIHQALNERYLDRIKPDLFIEEWEVQAEETLDDLLTDANSFLESLLPDAQ